MKVLTFCYRGTISACLIYYHPNMLKLYLDILFKYEEVLINVCIKMKDFPGRCAMLQSFSSAPSMHQTYTHI